MAPLYNATPYEGVGGRGWCIVEQGSATVVAAHLAKAKAEGGLIERFARAEAARPKVIDITDGGRAAPRVITEDPLALLERTMDELGRARFTFPSDKAMAEEMMAGFEWTIKSAMEQAELAQHADLLTVDPAVERRTLLRSRLRPPASSRRGSRIMMGEVGGTGDRAEVDLAAVELA